MTIATKRTANGNLSVTLDSKRMPIKKAVELAVLENRSPIGKAITIANERGASYDYYAHIHYSNSNFSLNFDCKMLEDAVRNFADWR